jgi:hypothetical protein
MCCIIGSSFASSVTAASSSASVLWGAFLHRNSYGRVEVGRPTARYYQQWEPTTKANENLDYFHNLDAN